MHDRQRRWLIALVALAGLLGGLGVVGSAVAAHRAGGSQLATASQFLILHALLVLAVGGIAQASGRPHPWLVIASAVVAGVCLFSGDLAVFALTGRHLFPMAAPTGGVVLIASWTAIAVLAAWRLARGAPL